MDSGGGAPFILGASGKAGNRKPIVGKGEYTYEVTHDWGQLPADIQYGNTHGVCEDSQGRIYVHHTVNAASERSDSMVVFDADGKFIQAWGKEFKGGAHGLHLHKEGNSDFLYLCDTQRGLVKATLDGEEVFSIGYPVESEFYEPGTDGTQKKYCPTNLAIAPNGDIYVADGYSSSYINVYNIRGKYRFSFGGPGKEPGQVSCPHGIICDTRGIQPVITVADRGNNRIQNFTLDGKHIEFISGTNLPCHFNIHGNGDVVVPDLGARVTLLDRNNQVITHLGDDSAANSWKSLRKESRDKFIP